MELLRAHLVKGLTSIKKKPSTLHKLKSKDGEKLSQEGPHTSQAQECKSKKPVLRKRAPGFPASSRVLRKMFPRFQSCMYSEDTAAMIQRDLAIDEQVQDHSGIYLRLILHA